jgi:hypothetical protein
VNAHQRIILRFLVAGFAAFGLALAFYRYLMGVSPTAPDASTGRACPMDEHGYVFFITGDQRFGFFALLAVFCILVLIATVLSVRWKEFQSPRDYLELFRRNI